LLRETKFVVKKSMATLGRDYSDPPRGWLIHQRWKRDGICPRHGTPLRRATIGGRTTAWCPKCQRRLKGTTSLASPWAWRRLVSSQK
jgi:formamidopyrimidine-DNA glycosylase